MIKHGIDQEALIAKFSQATAKQGEALQKAVLDATLKALQGRELTLSNIRQVLGTVAKSASAGAAGSTLGAVDVEGLLGKAFSGMDAALEQTVKAHRMALAQMVEQGASLREAHVKKALADIEKMEDTLFAAVRKASGAASSSLEGMWAQVLTASQGKSTSTGAQATNTLEQLTADAQKGLREGRALGLKASQAMLDGYTTLVSGVLIGMSDALRPAAKPSAAAPSARKRAT